MKSVFLALLFALCLGCSPASPDTKSEKACKCEPCKCGVYCSCKDDKCKCGTHCEKSKKKCCEVTK